MAENGVILLVDNLELLIKTTAPFTADFLRRIMIFQTYQDAPFEYIFSGIITCKLIRKKVNDLNHSGIFILGVETSSQYNNSTVYFVVIKTN